MSNTLEDLLNIEKRLTHNLQIDDCREKKLKDRETKMLFNIANFLFDKKQNFLLVEKRDEKSLVPSKEIILKHYKVKDQLLAKSDKDRP